METQKFGVYEIQEEIGRGGMATIFRAYQPAVDRMVALKVIKTSFANKEDALHRFQREARMIARLEHPHIVPIYDYDGGHEPPYIVMRFVEGGSLTDLLSYGLLPLAKVAMILQQVSAALDYAHRQGVIHRDIKPSNVLMDKEGNAFLTDFGIARLLQQETNDARLTQAGAIVGTPAYLSPEQAANTEAVDHRADIYSMGVMLFQMVTGQLPYDHENAMKVVLMHLYDPLPSAIALRPSISPALEEVIQRAMAKDPEDRFQTAREFSEAAIAALSEGLPTTAPQAGLSPLPTPEGDQKAGLATRKRQKASTTPVFQTEIQKNITVLYANAALFAEEIGAELGNEVAHEAVERLWNAAQDEINRMGGAVFNRAENVIFALWGVETAREDDPVRAVETGLTMQRLAALEEDHWFPARSHPDPLGIDIGVHTGPALLTTRSSTGAYTASGATISLGSRLMQQARGTVLITQGTAHLVQGRFVLEPAEALRPSRGREPLPVFRVMAARPHAFRMYTRGIEGVETPLVGREAELKRLQNAYLDALEDRQTQALTIVGAAGIGKSRLVYEFLAWMGERSTPSWLLGARTTPDTPEESYGLLKNLLALQFGLQLNSEPEKVSAALQAGMRGQIGVDDAQAHLLGHLAGIEFANSPHVQALQRDPRLLERQGRSMFVRWIQRLCDQRLVVIVLQDIHQADEPSLNLFMQLITDQPDLPLLVVSLSRPDLYEARPEWGSGLPHHTRMDLLPLDRRASRVLVESILHRVPELPRKIVDILADRAEGNPFYLEELIKKLMDDRVIVCDREDLWRLETSRLDYLDVPTTLVGLLQARLDGLLLPEKVILQRASVFGMVFYDRALSHLTWGEEAFAGSDSPPDQLETILDHLAVSGFIHRREGSDPWAGTSLAGTREYVFASGLMRDVVLNSLLTRQANAYHLAAADWYIQAAGERVEYFSRQIANHLDEGGNPDQAADWYIRAGTRALRLSAPRDAHELYSRAVRLVSQEDPARRLEALRGAGEAILILGDLEARSKIDQEMLALVRRIPNNRLLADVYYRTGYTAYSKGDDSLAVDLFTNGVACARRAGEIALEAKSLSLLVISLMRLGRLDQARSHLSRTLALAESAEDDEPRVHVYHNLSLYYSTIGDYGEAVSLLEKHIEIDRRLGDRVGEMNGLMNLGYVNLMLGQNAAARSILEQSLRIADQLGAAIPYAYNLLNLGLVQWRLEAPVAAFQVLESAASRLIQIKDAFAQAVCQTYQALVYESEGNLDRAAALYAAAAQDLQQRGITGYALDAQAGSIRCLLGQGDLAGALNGALELWNALDTDVNDVPGMELPALAYRTCVQVFEMTGESALAEKAVLRGCTLIQNRAALISDPSWRSLYLQTIPEHRWLVERSK